MGDSQTTAESELRQNIAREIVGLHKRYYGRGATTARTHLLHDDLIIVELRDVHTTVERTLIEKGQADAVRSTRRTFQTAMRDEFIQAVEKLTGRRVEHYENLSFVAPDGLLEIFALEPEAERQKRTDREQREDRGELERPRGGIADEAL